MPVESIVSGERLELAGPCEASDASGRAMVWPAGTVVRNVVTRGKVTSFEAAEGDVWVALLTTQAPGNLTRWAGRLSLTEVDTARQVRCPICGAAPGIACAGVGDEEGDAHAERADLGAVIRFDENGDIS